MGIMDGTVAIVTGAAQGMGEGQARMLAGRGARVIIADMSADAGEDAVTRIRAGGHAADFVQLNVGDADSWGAALEFTLSKHGRVDTLVNNAGIYLRASLDETTVEQFDRLFAINVRGVFLGCKTVVPAMRSGGGGTIVNVGSIASFVAYTSGVSAYSATKGAVQMLTKGLAADLAKDGIRVNAVHPGVVKTPMSAKLLDDPEARRQLLGSTLLGRAAEIDEIAEAVVFMASPASSFMTGSDLIVDGGFTAV
ncbi:glucose 1-dehydrogenase [Mesorhizobium sp. B2-3-5]|uniref:SDR family NAD(P)-dependent oxidoreductase n=1 Tax=Mesorhizobium sp. B2-3-5 TaxID=2589958 RepID=UPI00112E3B7B|nr:glucose 1-dehydrogenase [Mesorhizobium sp. B2-3-5]TPM24595.1 glucose 1-dehydrogenase [Mesorhizobium sp. B2-3-5]